MFESYEKLCNSFFFTLPIPAKLKRSYEDALEFAHIKTKAERAFTLAIILPSILTILGLFVLTIFNWLNLATFVVTLILGLVVFYFLYTYPFYARDVFRIKASEEMVFCILYMATALRISPNLERAIKYAQQNLSGALAQDLKEILWKTYTRKYSSFEEAFDSFIEKWRSDYEEFAEALYLLKNSISQYGEQREKTIREAVDFILNGTKQRMKEFAAQLKVPITVINALGILLPIVGLVFLPFVAIFMPETFQPVFLVIGYNVLLPLSVYYLAIYYLRKRPYSFHSVKIKEKFDYFSLILFMIFALLFSYLFWQASLQGGVFSEAQLFYSVSSIVALGMGIALYFYFSSRKASAQKRKIEKIEDEFVEAVYQLSNIVGRGMPLEKSLESLTAKIKTLEISKLFNSIVHNIKTFGVSFEKAVFDPKIGAIKHYNSSLINAILKAIAEISKKSFTILSKTLKDISTYLKNIKEVDALLKELLEETTSSMKIQALLLAPLSAGVVSSLTALMIVLILQFGNVAQSLFQDTSGVAGLSSQTFVTSFVNISQIMPFYLFQTVIGIYLIEIVIMISNFLASISKGDDVVEKKIEIAKNLIVASLIYFVVTILVYLMFSSIVQAVVV